MNTTTPHTAGRLAGRHALVTGAGSGIGAAIAMALAADGACVTLAGRMRDKLDRAAATLKDPARHGVVTLDVTDVRSVAEGLRQAEAERGPLDILVCNAGAAPSAPFTRITMEDWQATLAVNLTGVFTCIQAAIPGMAARKSGRVISIASSAGLTGYPYVAAYVAAKHGVIGLTRALAVEYARSGVTVNAVCPGFTDTPLLSGAVETIMSKTGRTADEARAALAKSNPQGRLVTPQEVADAVLWLCGPGAGSINGQAIAVDGGEVMTG
jgi:NAD(P)-dependent dehydrogenase (short-subunit alcohol dehydrogenase family)